MALAGGRSCQGCTQYCELLTCVLVSPSPQVSIDEAVDKDEDMKYKKGQEGESIITFQISEVVEKLFSSSYLEHFEVSPYNITCIKIKYFVESTRLVVRSVHVL